MDAQEMARVMREEHEQVRSIAEELRRHTADAPITAEWVAEFGRQVRQFRDHLRSHFALEEQGGYLTCVVEERPQLADDVETLKRQHEEMNLRLDALAHEAGALTPENDPAVARCRTEVGALLAALAEHEALEDHLVLTVLNEDVGTIGH